MEVIFQSIVAISRISIKGFFFFCTNFLCFAGLFDFHLKPGSGINGSKGRNVLKAHDSYC